MAVRFRCVKISRRRKSFLRKILVLVMIISLFYVPLFHRTASYTYNYLLGRNLPLKSLIHYPLDTDMPELVKTYKANKGNISFAPLNKYPYKFLSDIPEKCQVMEPISLIIMVKSAISNFKRRAVIRETWGNEFLLKEYYVKTIFLLGNPFNSTIQTLIDIEKKKYNDIVQIDYYDTYYNNTLKTIGAIRWVSQHCQDAKFTMLADDDFYFATEFIVHHLNSLPEEESSSLLMGHVWYDIPQRDVSDKWFIPIEDYPYREYPPFISAGATIMSLEMASDIAIAILFTKMFKYDDVFIAIVAYKLGKKPIHNDKIFIKKLEQNDKRFYSALASHHYDNETELRGAWNKHKACMAPGIDDCLQFGVRMNELYSYSTAMIIHGFSLKFIFFTSFLSIGLF